MLREIIQQLAQEHGVPVIIDEQPGLQLGDFKIDILLPGSIHPMDRCVLIACDSGPNVWLVGLGEEGQKIMAKSPELRYMRQVGAEGEKDE